MDESSDERKSEQMDQAIIQGGGRQTSGSNPACLFAQSSNDIALPLIPGEELTL